MVGGHGWLTKQTPACLYTCPLFDCRTLESRLAVWLSGQIHRKVWTVPNNDRPANYDQCYELLSSECAYASDLAHILGGSWFQLFYCNYDPFH